MPDTEKETNGYTIPRWFTWVLGIGITFLTMLTVPWANSVASSLTQMQKSVTIIEVKLDSMAETRNELRIIAAANATRSIDNDKKIDSLAALFEMHMKQPDGSWFSIAELTKRVDNLERRPKMDP